MLGPGLIEDSIGTALRIDPSKPTKWKKSIIKPFFLFPSPKCKDVEEFFVISKIGHIWQVAEKINLHEVKSNFSNGFKCFKITTFKEVTN